jgi:general stress protein 26
MATVESVPAQLWRKLAQAEACWFCSVRPDGRAHTAPIWHVWHAHEIYVVSQPQSVRARNIARNPWVSISLPDPMNVLIVEGVARFTPDARDALQPLFLEKYGWNIGTDTTYRSVIAVSPRKVMAWGNDGDGRWHLGGAQPV